MIATLLLVLSAAHPAHAGAVPAPVQAPEPSGSREVRPDGMEVVVLPVDGARTVSLRWVVHAGSASDPAGKEGLAHLLEHAILGARGPDGLDLPEAARAAGAVLNARTTRSATTFLLDASADVFPALAERLVRAVTDPALQRVKLDRELDIIAREAEYHGDGSSVATLIEDALLRGSAPASSILGTGGTLDRVRHDDLIRFYRIAYGTSNTTVVVAGAVDAPTVDGLLDRAVLLPPAIEGERPPTTVTVPPVLPINDRIHATFLAVVLGYVLDGEDRERCDAIADLVERRLIEALVAPDRPRLREVEATCVEVQGTAAVVALGYTRSLDAPDLPASIQRGFDETARLPASAAERSALELRRRRLRERTVRDPAALADDVAQVSARRPGAAVPLPRRALAPFPAEQVRSAAHRAFVPERRFEIIFTPFEG